MKIEFHLPFNSERKRYNVTWPKDWPHPNIGDAVITEEGKFFRVRDVVWYPRGAGVDTEQFVYIILGESDY